MQNTHTSNVSTIYNYLLHNSSSTTAQIVQATQLTVAQVNSALQNLQQRKLIASYKQQQQRTQYSAVVARTVKFNVAHTLATHTLAQQRSIAQYAKQMLTSMLAKFKHIA